MAKTYRPFRSDVKKGLYKINISVSEDVLNWFFRLSTKMKKKGGYLLPRTYIMRALINVFMDMNINVEGVKTEQELEERIKQAIKKH